MASQQVAPRVNRGLGRLWVPDERDRGYSIRRLLRASSTLNYRYWRDDGWWGDQGLTPHCVGFSWTHRLKDYPSPAVDLAPDPDALYHRAQLLDEWEGTAYDGTSIRAGAKTVVEAGLASGYYWAHTVEEMVDTVLSLGPLVVGTNWYSEMETVDRWGFVHASGQPLGGHAYVINGASRNTQKFRIKNSWGRGWGNQGRAFISFADMAYLLDEFGEACYLPLGE